MQPSVVFHNSSNTLGEGLFVDSERGRVFWTDILESRIYQKCLDSGICNSFDVTGHPSAIVGATPSEIVFCNRVGVSLLDLESSSQTVLSENPDTFYDEGRRANDGVALGNGFVIYGTMELTPREDTGGLYLYDGNVTCSLNVPIGIPNGFVLLEEPNILIADSLAKKINLFEIDETNRRLRFVRCWHDFSSEHFTPDGGCADYNGNVYFALWDGSGVAVLDYSGNLIEIISLPVPRPTNCKLAGDKRLLVTTAREGLTHDQVGQAPLVWFGS